MSAPVDVLAWIQRQPCRCMSVAQLGERDPGCGRCLSRAAVAELLHYGSKIEQRRRGVLHGDEDAVAQDWAEFRAALARCGGAK